MKPLEEKNKTASFARLNLFLLGIITLIAAVAVLKIAASVILPCLVAILLSFVLEPVVIGLEKIKIPRAVGAVVLVVVAAVVVSVIGFGLYQSAKTIVSLYPKYEERFMDLYMFIAKAFSLPYDEHLSLFQNMWGQLGIRVKIQTLAVSTSESFLSFIGDTVMVILFIVFFLLEMGHFRKRIELAFEGKLSSRIHRIMTSVVREIARYLSIKFFTSLATGILVGLLLTWIGLDFPVLWGVIVFAFNFIPTLGSIIAGAGVTLFSLAQFWPNFSPISATIATVVAVNFILGNIVEPRVQGNNLGLSPFVILVSLTAWGWLWGFSGLILAIPMTVIIKIICENIPWLEPVSIMMGSYREVKIREEPEVPPSEISM